MSTRQYLLILLLLTALIVSCGQRSPKVLLYIRGDGLNSLDYDYMRINEAGVMQGLLEQSGFDVVVATVAGEPIITDSTSLTPDAKLADIKIADYAGFIIPCMADSGELAQEAISLVKEFVAAGKPVAAQFGGVHILAKAGVLEGKKFALFQEPDLEEMPEYKGAEYSGQGIIQDGNLITSGNCPFIARARNVKDGTAELTQKLIEAMKI
jgi:protease I